MQPGQYQFMGQCQPREVGLQGWVEDPAHPVEELGETLWNAEQRSEATAHVRGRKEEHRDKMREARGGVIGEPGVAGLL